eukprot:190732-Chlamydomonas_euryale.AAC.20
MHDVCNSSSGCGGNGSINAERPPAIWTYCHATVCSRSVAALATKAGSWLARCPVGQTCRPEA